MKALYRLVTDAMEYPAPIVLALAVLYGIQTGDTTPAMQAGG